MRIPETAIFLPILIIMLTGFVGSPSCDDRSDHDDERDHAADAYKTDAKEKHEFHYRHGQILPLDQIFNTSFLVAPAQVPIGWVESSTVCEKYILSSNSFLSRLKLNHIFQTLREKQNFSDPQSLMRSSQRHEKRRSEKMERRLLNKNRKQLASLQPWLPTLVETYTHRPASPVRPHRCATCGSPSPPVSRSPPPGFPDL